MKVLNVVFCLFVSINLSSMLVGQSVLDNHLLYNLEIFVADSTSKSTGIATKKTFLYTSDSNKIPLEEVHFDKNGYIKKWVKYDTGKLHINVQVQNTKKSDSLIQSFIQIDCQSLHFLRDRYHFAYEFRALESHCDSSGSKAVLQIEKQFKKTFDTSVLIVTKIKKRVVDSIRSFYPSLGIISYPVLERAIVFDTLFNGDSIVLVNRFAEDFNRTRIVKNYMLIIRQEPVKREEFVLIGDSLVNYFAIEDTLDIQGRVVSHRSYIGLNKEIWESVNIKYDELIGRKIVEKDLSPIDGKPDLIWSYDKNGRLLKYSNFDKKGEIIDFVYSYNRIGLIVTKEKLINGISIFKEVYEYKMN